MSPRRGRSAEQQLGNSFLNSSGSTRHTHGSYDVPKAVCAASALLLERPWCLEKGRGLQTHTRERLLKSMNKTTTLNNVVFSTIYFNPKGELKLNSVERWALREGCAKGPRGFIPAWIILANGLQAASLDAPALPTWLVKGLDASGHNTALLG